MGQEGIILRIDDDVREIRNQLNGLWSMTSEILTILQKEQPKDRQDKEKEIKDTMPSNMDLVMSKKDTL